MKRILFSFLLFVPMEIIQASDKAVDLAHLKLAEYFQKGIDQECRVKQARILVLTSAADQLQAGISREKLRGVRDQLEKGLLPNSANQPILEEMRKIQENHRRIYCCRPWIFQSTLNREAESLHNVIDDILKKEHPNTYESLKAGNNRMHTLGTDCPVAYSVPAFATASSIPSAPPLQQSLLGSQEQKR